MNVFQRFDHRLSQRFAVTLRVVSFGIWLAIFAALTAIESNVTGAAEIVYFVAIGGVVTVGLAFFGYSWHKSQVDTDRTKPADTRPPSKVRR